MIENKLTFSELLRILQPVLALKDAREFMSTIEAVFNIKVKTVNDIYDYMYKYRVSYEGFQFNISNLRCDDYGHIHIETQFRIEKAWRHSYTRPEIKVIESIKKICKSVINKVVFSEYERSQILRDRNGSKLYTFKYFYDSLAFNFNHTKDGITISPLIMGFSDNAMYRFVQFYFNPLCYEVNNENICLKKNWLEYI